MNKTQLDHSIAVLRNEMYLAACQWGNELSHPQLVSISQKLDGVLNEHMKAEQEHHK